MPIMDCDETFNYWEVVHFLLFRENSFQTWEYSNEFALRTYAYLTPVVNVGRIYLKIIERDVLPSWLWPLLTDQQFDPSTSSKVAVFLLLRSSLGAAIAYAEVSFCQAIFEQSCTEDDMTNKDGEELNKLEKVDGKATDPLRFALVGWLTECLLLSSAGMAHSAAALLPSSTLMGFWMLAAAAYLRKENVYFCVLAITATLAIGWPFGVIVFVPLGIGVLAREQKQIISFIFLRIVPITIVVQGLVMLVDYQHYGRLVSPSLNILLYNTQAGGDELYGVEPLSYYIKNLLLNFNYVAIGGGIGALPLFWLGSFSSTWRDFLVLMAPLYIWIGIVFPRPHKEERFLYPAYPCLCLGAAIFSVCMTQGVVKFFRTKMGPAKQEQEQKLKRDARINLFIVTLIWIPAATISWSRTFALSKYYTAPLRLYSRIPAAIEQERGRRSVNVEGSDLNDSSADVICTCGEWYRFPSSFFVGSNAFGFAPSTFNGQLPQLFSEEGSGPSTTSSNRFNDKNQPEMGSYTPLESCDFVVELSASLNSCLGLSGSNREDTPNWTPIDKEAFLNADATTSAIHRILYIPILHDYAVESGRVQYTDFALYSAY